MALFDLCCFSAFRLQESGPIMTHILRFARAEYRMLANNHLHKYAAGHALVHYPSGAVCTYIPKNGCTNLRYSLALAHGCITGPEDFGWIHNNNTTFQAELADLVRAPYTFVFLRCPLARLASVFLDKIVGRTIEAWHLYRLADGAFDRDNASFRDFCALMEAPKYRNSNPHWRPQSDFLVYETYDDYFALSGFDAAARRIKDRCGLVLHDTRAFSDHGLGRYETADLPGAADLPIAELAEMQRQGRSPTHAMLYDNALIDRISHIYAADLTLYRDTCGETGLLFP